MHFEKLIHNVQPYGVVICVTVTHTMINMVDPLEIFSLKYSTCR
jgi:hypothetical protein